MLGLVRCREGRLSMEGCTSVSICSGRWGDGVKIGAEARGFVGIGRDMVVLRLMDVKGAA